MADVSEEELAEFFENLPESQRSSLLDKFSRDDRQRIVRWLYLRKHKLQQLPQFARATEPDWWSRGGAGDGRFSPFRGSREGPPRRSGNITPPPGLGSPGNPPGPRPAPDPRSQPKR
jgi:hypothetical protein